MISPDPSGWTVAVTRPDTGRVKTPDVLDLQDAPAINPGPNGQPELRVPVRKDDVWLSEAYDDDPEMRVWMDGRRLPIEVLRDVEQREDATVLVGVGGVELETRVSEEYNDDRRHIAARDLVESETDYAVDAPEPDTATLQDVVQQDVSTEAELNSVSSFSDGDAIVIDGDIARGKRVAWTVEGESFDRGQTTRTEPLPTNPDNFAGGDWAQMMADDNTLTRDGDFAEWDFTVTRPIPSEEFGCQVRDKANTDDGSPAFTWTLIHPDGSEYLIDSLSNVGVTGTSISWTDIGRGFYDNLDGYTGPDLPIGEYTLRVEVDDSEGTLNYAYYVDVVAPYDLRAESELFFDDNNGGDGSALDGPGWYVAQDAAFDNSPSAFNVVAGSADITINDTSGAQRVQISNNNGDTWLPDDGTENNTTSVSVDYPTAGSGSRLRVTLDGWEPNGPRNETPRLNYASQELDAYTLRADIAQELLLIEETFDNDLASVLTDIAEPAEMSWRFAFDGDTPTVRFVQDGQFTADFTPEFEGRTREKLGKTYDSVTIKGSHEPVSNEPYTADTTFTPLVRSNILAGSETVYDDAENYERGDDYEIRYRDGEIRATSGGDLTPGDGYRIDYRYQAQGTFENPDAPDDPDELVETVPGVTSERLAEQVAFVIASDVSTPRYAAEVTIPDPDPRFDPVDSLPPEALGVPTGVSPLEVRGDPELTERGLRVRFGTRPAVESSLQRLSRQVSRVTDRS